MTSEGCFLDQVEIPCVFMRGGTSKALFFHERDLPPAGADRDEMLKRAMGTPDASQIDGMGGAKLNTSKVAIISASTRPGVDVDYTFAQIELADDSISYDGNCGNISSAVGPFAIDEGLVAAIGPITTVRIYNTNTAKVLIAKVPVAEGKAKVLGQCAIPGVPGTGAEIMMDYAGTIGSRTGHLLPTGNPVDVIALNCGRTVDVSICDVANPCVFVAANSLGLRGDEMPSVIEGDPALIALTNEIRGRVGQLLGFWPDWRAGPFPAMPMIVIVAPAGTASSVDLTARLLYLGRCHPTMAGTGAICLAAASRVPGTVVHLAAGRSHDAPILRIGHPKRSLGCESPGRTVDISGADAVRSDLGFARTARRLMEGRLYLPAPTASLTALVDVGTIMPARATFVTGECCHVSAVSTMKAVRIDRYGGPEVLTLCNVPIPTPAEGEVLVRMAHAGINVMDVATRTGMYANSQTYTVRLPTTLGMEGAGVVEQVGPGVMEFAAGDRVAYCLVWNTYAEYAVVPAWRLVPVPDHLPLHLAAAAIFQGLTAHYLATDVGQLAPGRTCLVHAAAGGVGGLLVGLARRLGATVYGTVRAEPQKRVASERGAVEVFLSAEGGFVEPLLEATSGNGVDVVFDSIGRPTLRHDFKVTRRRGLVVSFGASGGAIDDLNPSELGEAGSLYLTRPRLGDHLTDAGTIRRRAAEFYAALADGSVSLIIGKRYGLDRIRDAHIELEGRSSGGKSVLDIGGASEPG